MINIPGLAPKKRPLAESYVNTGAAGVLAIMKMLETLAALLGIVMLVFVSDMMTQTIRTVTQWINQTVNFIMPEKIAETVNNLVRVPMLLPVLILLMIVLDGIGVLLMRYAGFGEGLVRLVHRICWFRYLAEIILLIIGMLRFVFGLDDFSRTFGNNSSLYASLGSMKILVWILFFANLLILLFYCNFHNDICTVLHAVSQERKAVNPVKVGRNNLAGRSSCFAAGAGCYFLLSAFGFIYPLLTNTKLISDEKLGQYTDIPAMVLLGVNMFISLIAFAKYLSLSICAGKFKKLHKN